MPSIYFQNLFHGLSVLLKLIGTEIS